MLDTIFGELKSTNILKLVPSALSTSTCLKVTLRLLPSNFGWHVIEGRLSVIGKVQSLQKSLLHQICGQGTGLARPVLMEILRGDNLSIGLYFINFELAVMTIGNNWAMTTYKHKGPDPSQIT